MGFQIKNTVLLRYTEEPGEEKVIIPDGVTCIGIQAFAWCRQIKEVVIPASVQCMEEEAFRSCLNLERVFLSDGVWKVSSHTFDTFPPDIIYRGILISLHRFYFPPVNTIMQMMCRKKLTAGLDKIWKYNVIWAFFCDTPEDKNVIAYIEKDAENFLNWLIENSRADILQRVVQAEKFLTAENIDKLINYAIANKQHEIYVLLTDYKYQHFEFQDPAEKLKL